MARIFTPLMVGTDAEVFLKSRYTDKPVSAIGLIGGTKMYPKAIEGFGEGYALQEDNVMPEFNVPPSDSAVKFSESIQRVLDYLANKLYDQKLVLDISASRHFEKSQLDHPQAQTFGCDPDINCWTHEGNEIERWNPLLETMRTAAAHIHVSYLVNGVYPIEYEPRALAVRAHELFVGVPSILVDPDTERRQIYGKAGAFRVTDYGHEYRTPSNFWIKTDQRRLWVFNQTIRALDFVNDSDNVETLNDDLAIQKAIQDCINNHDEDLAQFLVNEFDLVVPR